MVWAVAKFSKEKVKRAGVALTNIDTTASQYKEAMEVLSNWRAAHTYPMQAVLVVLRKMAYEVDKRAVVVQRLKRTPSITKKLEIYTDMNLSRMQDIAGCRAVVKSIKEVTKLKDKIVKSRTRNKLHNTKDYINDPKDTGYRGIHLIYKYNGAKQEYKDYFVEIQIRSKIQHAWATAVEIIDTFTHQALKANNGELDWLNYFRYVSVEFAKLENSPTGNIAAGIDTKSEVVRLSRKLNVQNRLNAFAVSTKYLTKKGKKSGYFLLELTKDATKISVTQFQASQLEEATIKYLEKEEQAKNDDAYDVVLVAANSIHALKTAYPNYFAQSKDFLKLLNDFILLTEGN